MNRTGNKRGKLARLAGAIILTSMTSCATVTPEPVTGNYCDIAEPIETPKAERGLAPVTEAGALRENKKFFCTCDEPGHKACPK